MKEQDIISNLNLFSEKVFKVLEKEVYDILDKILNIKPEILTSEPLKDLCKVDEVNGIIALANALILFYVLEFVFSQLICIYNGKNVESVYKFVIKVIIIGIVVNNSYFICEMILKVFDGLSNGIDLFCKNIAGNEITFNVLKENIYKIKNIEKSDALSIEGLIKSIVSLGSVSVLVTLSIRYVTVIILLLIAPFALLSMCSNLTSGFSKTWLKTLVVNLSMQIVIKLIILIPIVYKDTKSSIYKAVIIGALYLLYKINSFVSSIFARFSEGR